MSRKSVIQLVPAPVSRDDASDLRYRLLMAALGSSDAVNPLLAAPDARDDADEAPEAETVAESALAHADQAVPSAEPRAVERLAVAELEDQAPSLSLVRPQVPSSAPMRHTVSEAPPPTGATPLPRPPKRR